MPATSKNQHQHINRSPDGRLLASRFQLDVCGSCDSGHFDLFDQHDKAFATATVPPELFRELAAWFTDAAGQFEAKSGRKLD